jgi:transcriptional regulator with XRE-family HTH domain
MPNNKIRPAVQPFGAALTALLEKREMSGRELSRQLQSRYEWGSRTMVSLWSSGEVVPGRVQIERIAATLNVPATHFAEYRLLVVRRSLDPDIVGLKKALRNLAALQRK